jgi:hypothetical protein
MIWFLVMSRFLSSKVPVKNKKKRYKSFEFWQWNILLNIISNRIRTHDAFLPKNVYEYNKPIINILLKYLFIINTMIKIYKDKDKSRREKEGGEK